MDLTAIGVGFGYVVVVLTILVVVVGVSALFVFSIKSDYLPPDTTGTPPGRKRIGRAR
ncbi:MULTISPECIES: adenylate cyclase [unclassified Rhodococcus (in: high G+C Gram-positive bacteria)]|uniref:adenylate cyclase n=1 Tax=unclassified Rhodococcus (in: high G+C Gram-positive bacteria) TaxID=192944 RepID=UPI00163B2771|nr:MULTISPECIES: adenylate cyclase [unclassified Rhodococcus (in: high G+C Gram-positive bacteria)]MBC2644149.1 adenylate cyclase [Rhodococcus sp. 3A]MBC2891112.1 adenylate cyclase [Rhodococcus sp. 4CII]